MTKKSIKKLVFSAIFASISALIITSCSGNGAGSTSTTVPSTVTTTEPDTSTTTGGTTTTTIIDEGDGYVDVLPEKTSDGTILQAFNWTYNQIKDNLDSIAAAGFKSVQTSPVQQPKSGGASWWCFYQPLSFSIADNSPLGTKQDLKDLCDAAEERNVSIIVDIVFNHMANISDEDLEPDGTPTVSPDVLNYEPEIYNNRNASGNDATFHHNPNATGSGAITQVYQYGKLPDLNTANPIVQERSLDLLKECIDVGVDGFRFDAAKHIETPDDPQYASDFWTNVLGGAKTYYKTKTGKDLYSYGEILNNAEGGRSNSLYTKIMDITEDGYISRILTGTASKNGETVASANYTKNVNPANLVTWVDSHDSYEGNYPITYESRLYGILASRSQSRPMFLAHPDSDKTVGTISNYDFESETIAVGNRFHNRFLNCEENLFGQGAIFVNERYSNTLNGAYLCDTKHRSAIDITFDKLPDGVYYDQLTGKQCVVSNKQAHIELDSSGVCVLTRTKNLARPRFSLSSRSGGFIGKLELTAKIENATNAYYKVNNGEQIKIESDGKISITSDVDLTIEFVISNDQFSITRKCSYKSVQLIDGYFNVVDFNLSYFDDYEVYLWSWGNGKAGSWSKDYIIQDGVMLVDFNDTSIAKFLIALFPKDYVITNLTKWDNECVKQTNDIEISKKFYDASSF